MPRKRNKRLTPKVTSATSSWAQHRLREGVCILIGAFAVFFLLALMSYHQSDPSWSATGTNNGYIANAGGRVGAMLSDVLLYVFGYLAYAFPLMIGYSAWFLYREQREHDSFNYALLAMRVIGFVIVLLSGCGLMSLMVAHQPTSLPYTAGGIIGSVVGPELTPIFNELGTVIILLALFMCGLTLATGVSWVKVADTVGRWTMLGAAWLYQQSIVLKDYLVAKREERKQLKLQQQQMSPVAAKPKIVRPEPVARVQAQPAPVAPQAAAVIKPKIMPTVSRLEPSLRAEKDRQVPLFVNNTKGTLPSLSLLDPAEKNSNVGYSETELQSLSEDVERRLLDFGVQAKVVAVHPGPVVTRFELELAPGIKASKVTGLAKDLARSLSVMSVRVVEIIPGKPYVGIELPNNVREIVRLSEILGSKEYDDMHSPITLGLGKDIAGHPVVVDLGKMPHLLVAGTTGSGKSVGVNATLNAGN